MRAMQVRSQIAIKMEDEYYLGLTRKYILGLFLARYNINPLHNFDLFKTEKCDLRKIINKR